MTLEHSFSLNLPGSLGNLFRPDLVFAARGPFDSLALNGELLEGTLVAEAPLLGEIRMPFRSQVIQLAPNRAQLKALPLENSPAFWAELEGEGDATEEKLFYKLHLRIHAHLPEGEKWGGKALRKMAEAAFERQIHKTLQTFQG